MNQQPQQILIVEIKTVESASINTEQLHSMVIYVDSNHNYFLSTGIERIKSAILDAIVHLGSNYRHPLLFKVQVVPGDEQNAYLSSIKDGIRQRRIN